MQRQWWEAWRKSGIAIGAFQSRILLGLFYFVVVAPFGVAVRAFGDPLQIRGKKRPSQWLPKGAPADVSLDECRRQF